MTIVETIRLNIGLFVTETGVSSYSFRGLIKLEIKTINK